MVVVLLFVSCDPTIDIFSFDLPEEGSIVDERDPEAFFGATVGDDATWFEVEFANTSSSANSYYWDFGDESGTSTEFEPTYRYLPLSGTNVYTVTLTVTDGNGITDVYQEDVEIIDNGIDPDIEYSEIYNWINPEEDNGDPVSITYISREQVDLAAGKTNYATNSLDKDPSTRWTADDLPAGSERGDGEYLIYDLGDSYQLRLVQLTFDLRTVPYGYQIWVSNTGTEDDDFIQIEHDIYDMFYSEPGSVEFLEHEMNIEARYVKLIVFGRYQEVGSLVRASQWSNVTQIEFYSQK